MEKHQKQLYSMVSETCGFSSHCVTAYTRALYYKFNCGVRSRSLVRASLAIERRNSGRELAIGEVLPRKIYIHLLKPWTKHMLVEAREQEPQALRPEMTIRHRRTISLNQGHFLVRTFTCEARHVCVTSFCNT